MISWVSMIGCAGVGAVIFAQTALFFCFFLPGDSLLFIAGLLSAKGYFNLFSLIVIAWLSAWFGYMLAFSLGKKFAAWLEACADSFWFKRKHLEKARLFLAKHGQLTVLLAFFTPVIRTFVPVAMGMANYPTKRFILTALVGSLGWALIFSVAGYLLATRFPALVHYLLPLSLVIIMVSLLPALISFLRESNN